MEKYFMPNGEEILREEFIKFYNNCYYVTNSKCVEDEIDSLLKKEIKTREDFKMILAWKIGRINHKKSRFKGETIFSESWKEKDETKIAKLRNGNELDIYELLNLISDNDDLVEESKKDDQKAQEVLCKINQTEGIGTVYLITLLYFISNGKYPIFDQFASAAVNAITKGKKPGEKVSINNLPDRKNIDNLLIGDKTKGYLKFKRDIEKIFKYYDYQNNRDVDRALWVYGHLFT
ncbi:MAG: hypothetical protein J1E81_07715 [Eubacterium sp.]|nr:hypothetical protein [Eubacterium sp.]